MPGFTAELGLTQVVLLYVADVAVDGGVTKDDQHDGLATAQLHAMGRVALHSVNMSLGRRADDGASALP